MAQQQQQQQHLQPCNYRISRTLGSGSYATVKEAIHIVTGQRFAAKVINKRLMQGKEQLVRNEITVLKKVSHGHPNVLTMYDYFESTNNLYLILELCTGPELFNYIVSRETFFERDAARMMRDIVDGVSYLHDNGIVHRDLKPENIMFKDSSPESPLLIADFGLSRILETEQYVLNTLCGTRGYMSPEIIKRRGHGKPVDIWALGVIAYFILSGIPPFDRGQDLRAEEQAIVTADYRFEPAETHWNFISFDAKDFINKCLVIDPAQRMTAKSALAHTWLRQVSPTPKLAPPTPTYDYVSSESIGAASDVTTTAATAATTIAATATTKPLPRSLDEEQHAVAKSNTDDTIITAESQSTVSKAGEAVKDLFRGNPAERSARKIADVVSNFINKKRTANQKADSHVSSDATTQSAGTSRPAVRITRFSAVVDRSPPPTNIPQSAIDSSTSTPYDLKSRLLEVNAKRLRRAVTATRVISAFQKSGAIHRARLDAESAAQNEQEDEDSTNDEVTAAERLPDDMLAVEEDVNNADVIQPDN